MKSSISISNYIAQIATNILPTGNVIVRGVVYFIVAGSFSASFQLTNNHIAPMFKIPDSANSWVLTGKFKRSHCILWLHSPGQSTFPTYFTSTSYVSFPIPFPDSCLCYSALLSYYQAVASSRVLVCFTRTYMVYPDNIWLYRQFIQLVVAHRSSLLTNTVSFHL